jgi:hypothetical protein
LQTDRKEQSCSRESRCQFHSWRICLVEYFVGTDASLRGRMPLATDAVRIPVITATRRYCPDKQKAIRKDMETPFQ